VKRHVVLSLCFTLLVAQAPPGLAPTAPPAPVDDSREVTLIPPGQAYLEEASLVPEARLAVLTGETRTGKAYTKKDELTGRNVTTGMSDTKAEPANALRLYGIIMAPKETIHFRLKAENDKIIMRVIKPEPPDAMTGAVRLANAPPTPLRRSRLSIQNVTDRPYAIRLLLYGEAGHKYRLDIEHKK
jgi:hypothetical protein